MMVKAAPVGGLFHRGPALRCRLLALFRHGPMFELSLLSGVNRTSRLRPPTSEFDSFPTFDPKRLKLYFIISQPFSAL
jgi:hypothetical protein